MNGSFGRFFWSVRYCHHACCSWRYIFSVVRGRGVHRLSQSGVRYLIHLFLAGAGYFISSSIFSAQRWSDKGDVAIAEVELFFFWQILVVVQVRVMILLRVIQHDQIQKNWFSSVCQLRRVEST